MLKGIKKMNVLVLMKLRKFIHQSFKYDFQVENCDEDIDITELFQLS